MSIEYRPLPEFSDPLVVEGLGVLSGADRAEFIRHYEMSLGEIDEVRDSIEYWEERTAIIETQVALLDAGKPIANFPLANVLGATKAEQIRQLLMDMINCYEESIAVLDGFVEEHDDPMREARTIMAVDIALSGLERVIEINEEVARIESSDELSPDSATAVWGLQAEGHAILDGNAFKIIGHPNDEDTP